MARNLRLSPQLSLPLEAVTQKFAAVRDIKWVAGLFEGEGCINHRPQKRGKERRLVIGSTDLDVLQNVQHILGMGRIALTSVRDKRKPYWRWTVDRWRDVERIGKALLPYLCIRRHAKMLLLLKDPPTRNTGFCSQGHPLQGPNADVYKHPGRSIICAICARKRARHRRAGRRAA